MILKRGKEFTLRIQGHCQKHNFKNSRVRKKTIFKNYGNKISKTDVEIYKRTKMCDF